MEFKAKGILDSLPKLELAKLVGEVEEVRVPAGHRLHVDRSILFVVEGRLRLTLPGKAPDEGADLGTVPPGEVVGEWVLLPDAYNPPWVDAVEDSYVVKIQASRWQALLEKHPGVNKEFQLMVLRRLHIMEQRVGRYRQHLNNMSKEVWPAEEVEQPVIPAPVSNGAAAMLASPVQAQAQAPKLTLMNHLERLGKPLAALHTVLCFLIGTVATVRLGLDGAGEILALLVLIWASGIFFLRALADYAVALIACLVAGALGIAGAKETFSGFADPAWFLLLGAFGIGAAIQRSGLLYRMSLHLLRLLPATYRGQASALVLAGTLITPAIPSVQSRVTMAGLLSSELSEAMRYSPRTKGAIGLAMSAFLGFAQMRFLFLNGSSYSILAFGLLPEEVRRLSGWFEWWWLALPLGLIVLFLTHLLTTRILYPTSEGSISSAVVTRQLKVLGPIGVRETSILVVTLAVVFGFITQPWHHIDASWIALSGFLILVWLGIVDKETVVKHIDWPYMLFYGALSGMISLISKSSLSEMLQSIFSYYLTDLLRNGVLFLALAAILTIMARWFFQPAPAIILVAVPLYSISLALHHPPLLVAIVIAAASTSWMVPQLLSSYTTLYSTTQGRCFDHQQVRLLAVLHSVILVVSVVLAGVIWQVTGALT